MGAVAGSQLRGVCAQVHRVRRAGAPDWLYHRAGDGATILAHVGEPTTAPAIASARSPPVEANAQQLPAPEAVEGIPELEFDQMANLTAEAGHDRLVADAGADADAEPVPELEFDQTLGW